MANLKSLDLAKEVLGGHILTHALEVVRRHRLKVQEAGYEMTPDLSEHS
jgi:hypothetical protein